MPRYDTSCPGCGRIERDVFLPAGKHPLCYCGTLTEYLWDTPLPPGIETDEQFIGGLTIENMGHEPVTVYSRAELNLEMARRGLEQRIKYVPGDKYLQNWAAYTDPQTLENARALVSRMK